MRWPWLWPWHNNPGAQMTELRCLLTEVRRVLDNFIQWEEGIMEQFDALVAEVGEIRTVRESVEAVVDGLLAKLETVKDSPTPEQLAALTADLRSSRDALAAAVVKGTPAA